MGKERVSFRLSNDALAKLEAIQKYESELAAINGYPASRKTDILEKAIKELYNNMINHTQDADVIERIDDTVEAKVRVAMKPILDTLDHLTYANKKNEIYWNVFSKTKAMAAFKELSEEEKINCLVKESSLSSLIDEVIYKKEAK